MLLEEVKSLRNYRNKVTSIQDQWMPSLGMKPMEEITAIDAEFFRSQRNLPNGETPSLSTVNKVHQLHCPFVFLYEGQSIQGIKHSFGGAYKQVGIEKFCYHDLRHGAATNLRRAGVDTVMAMKIIGHKSEKMHRRYNSVSQADLTQTTQKLNSYLF